MNAMTAIMNAVPALLQRKLSGEAIMDALWPAFQICITSGVKNEIDMPMALANVVGQKGVNLLKARFCSLIQAPVTAVEDSARGVMLITPLRPVLGHETIIPGVQKPKAKTLNQAKVARPANAFILYRKHHHPQIKAEQPDIHNNQISVIVGERWRNEDNAVKDRFVALAKQMKAKHLLEHPNYQYKPRKPSEKKHRMTRRKEAAFVNNIPSSSKSSVKKTSTTQVSEVPKTASGNAMLDLGSEDVHPKTLEAMLIEYNNSFPPATNQVTSTLLAQSSTPVIYDELTEEAQNDSNFYHSQHDFSPFMTSEEAGVAMDSFLEDVDRSDGAAASMSSNAQIAAFDQHNEYIFNAEVTRTAWDSIPMLPIYSQVDDTMSPIGEAGYMSIIGEGDFVN